MITLTCYDTLVVTVILAKTDTGARGKKPINYWRYPGGQFVLE